MRPWSTVVANFYAAFKEMYKTNIEKKYNKIVEWAINQNVGMSETWGWVTTKYCNNKQLMVAKYLEKKMSWERNINQRGSAEAMYGGRYVKEI